MNSHVDITDLVDFLFREKSDKDIMQKAARINAHLFHCPACRAQYQTILRFKQATDELLNCAEISQTEELKKRILSAIRTNPKLSEKLCTEKNSLNRIASFTIQKATNLTIPEQPNDLESFKRDVRQLRGSAYSLIQIKSSTGLKREACQIVLKDNDILEVYLDNSVCSEHEPAILIPRQKDLPILISVSERVAPDRLQIDFRNIGSGEYCLMF